MIGLPWPTSDISNLKCALFYAVISSLSLVGTWRMLLSLASQDPKPLYCLGQTEDRLCEGWDVGCPLKTDTENQRG